MNKSGLNEIERKTAAEGPWAARDEHERRVSSSYRPLWATGNGGQDARMF